MSARVVPGGRPYACALQRGSEPFAALIKHKFKEDVFILS